MTKLLLLTSKSIVITKGLLNQSLPDNQSNIKDSSISKFCL